MIVEVEQCVRSLSPAPMAACARRVQLAKRKANDTSSATCVSRVSALSLPLSLCFCVGTVVCVCVCACVWYIERPIRNGGNIRKRCLDCSFSDRSQFNGIYFIITVWQFMNSVITLILYNFTQISITVYCHINSFRGPV